MIKKHHVYKLANEYLKCTTVRKNGMNIFQICDKDGNIKPTVKRANGFISDYGTRLVYKKRSNELILIK